MHDVGDLYAITAWLHIVLMRYMDIVERVGILKSWKRTREAEREILKLSRSEGDVKMTISHVSVTLQTFPSSFPLCNDLADVFQKIQGDLAAL